MVRIYKKIIWILAIVLLVNNVSAKLEYVNNLVPIEGFEGVGTPSGYTSSVGSPNYDYTTNPFAESESVHFNSASIDMKTSNVDITDVTYFRVIFYVRSDVTNVYRYLYLYNSTSTGETVQYLGNNGNFWIDNVDTGVSYSANTWYKLQVDVNKTKNECNITFLDTSDTILANGQDTTCTFTTELRFDYWNPSGSSQLDNITFLNGTLAGADTTPSVSYTVYDDFAHAYNFDGNCADTVGNSNCTANSFTYSTANSPDGKNVAVMVQSNPSWMDYQDLDTTRMTGNSTVCMLFNTTDTGVGLLNKGGSTANPGWELYGSGGSYTLYEDGSSVGSAGTLTGASWELVCVSHNDTGIYAWEDGNLIITGTGRTPGSTTGQDFRSGTNPTQSTAWSIEGHVRFVYMWDRDLTNTEISYLYNSGNFNFCSGNPCVFDTSVSYTVYDDFEDASLNTSKWYYNGLDSVTETGGYMNINTQVTDSQTQSMTVTTKQSFETASKIMIDMYTLGGSSGTTQCWDTRHELFIGNGAEVKLLDCYQWNHLANDLGCTTGTQGNSGDCYGRSDFEIEYINNTHVNIKEDGNYIKTVDVSGASNKNITFRNTAHTGDTVGSDSGTSYFWIYNVNYTITDISPPTITYTDPTPNDNSHLINNSITIKVNVSDVFGINSCLLEWNGVNESMTYGGDQCYKTKTTVNGNNYTFKAYVDDTTGNWENTTERTIYQHSTNITAYDYYDGSTITSFNVTIDGTKRTTTTGNIYFDKPLSTYTALFEAPDYFSRNQSYTISDNNGNVSGWQSEFTVNVFEVLTNTTINNFNIDMGSYSESSTNGTITLYFKAGTYDLLLYSSGYINYTNDITLSTLEQRTDNISLGTFNLTITARNLVNNATISDFTIIINETTTGYSNTSSTSSGELNYMLLYDKSYGTLIDATGYELKTTSISGNETHKIYEFLLYTTNSIDFEFRDEITEELLNTTVDVDFVSSVVTYNFTTTNGTLYVDLLYPTTYIIRYSADGYGIRHYLFELTNRTYNTLTLYLINETLSNTVQVLVYDETTLNTIEEAVVYLQKYYIADNEFKTIAMYETDIAGQSYFNYESGEYYKFLVDYPFLTRKLETNKFYITSTTVNLYISLEDDITGTFFTEEGIIVSVYFDPIERDFTVTWSDSSLTASEFCLYIQEDTAYGKSEVNSTCSTSGSGSMSLAFPDINQSYGVLFKAKIEGVEKLLYGSLIGFEDDTLDSGKEGGFLAVIIVMIFALMSSFNFVSLILVDVSLILIKYLGLLNIAWGYVISIIIGSIILAIFLEMRK